MLPDQAALKTSADQSAALVDPDSKPLHGTVNNYVLNLDSIFTSINQLKRLYDRKRYRLDRYSKPFIITAIRDVIMSIMPPH